MTFKSVICVYGVKMINTFTFQLHAQCTSIIEWLRVAIFICKEIKTEEYKIAVKQVIYRCIKSTNVKCYKYLLNNFMVFLTV
jgi:hypothetical protein